MQLKTKIGLRQTFVEKGTPGPFQPIKGAKERGPIRERERKPLAFFEYCFEYGCPPKKLNIRNTKVYLFLAIAYLSMIPVTAVDRYSCFLFCFLYT